MATINKYWLIIGGALILTYNLYFKLLRPRVAGPINIEYTPARAYLYLALIIVFTLSLLLALYVFLGTGSETLGQGRKQSALVRLKAALIKNFLRIHKIYADMIDATGKPIFNKYLSESEKWHFWLPKISRLMGYIRLFLNLLVFFPPCLISIVFFLETTITHNYLFFPLSPIVIIPMLGFRILLYFLRVFLSENQCQIDENIERMPWVSTQDSPNITRWSWKAEPRITKDHPAWVLTNEDQSNLIIFKDQLKTYQHHLDSIRMLLVSAPERILYITVSLSLWIASFLLSANFNICAYLSHFKTICPTEK